MANISVFDNIVENKLLSLHTAYIARIISYSNGKATVQPLGVTKQYGKSAQTQSIVSNIPVIQSARYKLTPKTTNHVTSVSVSTSKSNGYVTDVSITAPTESTAILEPETIAAGDLVVCICAERNISEAKSGNIATPPVGHHSMSDSIVVGVL